MNRLVILFVATITYTNTSIALRNDWCSLYSETFTELDAMTIATTNLAASLKRDPGVVKGTNINKFITANVLYRITAIIDSGDQLV